MEDKKTLKARNQKISTWESLANAVIEQAVKDYREGYRTLYRRHYNSFGRPPEKLMYGNIDIDEYWNPQIRYGGAETYIKECERFFKSGWFRELTDILPEVLIRGLHDERKEFCHKTLIKWRTKENARRRKETTDRNAGKWRRLAQGR